MIFYHVCIAVSVAAIRLCSVLLVCGVGYGDDCVCALCFMTVVLYVAMHMVPTFNYVCCFCTSVVCFYVVLHFVFFIYLYLTV